MREIRKSGSEERCKPMRHPYLYLAFLHFQLRPLSLNPGTGRSQASRFVEMLMLSDGDTPLQETQPIGVLTIEAS